MRIALPLVVCMCLCLTADRLRGQTTIANPSNEESISTCLTLEHLLVIARYHNDREDASPLILSYYIARKYVSDSSALKLADDYVSFVSSHFDLPDYAGPKPAPGFIDYLASDKNHQSGVIVYGKNGSVENLHLALDKDSVTKLLKENGAVAAEGNKP